MTVCACIMARMSHRHALLHYELTELLAEVRDRLPGETTSSSSVPSRSGKVMVSSTSVPPSVAEIFPLLFRPAAVTSPRPPRPNSSAVWSPSITAIGIALAAAAGDDRQPGVAWHGWNLRRHGERLYLGQALADIDSAYCASWDCSAPLVLPGNLGCLLALEGRCHLGSLTRIDAACRSRAISVDEMRLFSPTWQIRNSGPTVPYTTLNPAERRYFSAGMDERKLS